MSVAPLCVLHVSHVSPDLGSQTCSRDSRLVVQTSSVNSGTPLSFVIWVAACGLTFALYKMGVDSYEAAQPDWTWWHPLHSVHP